VILYQHKEIENLLATVKSYLFAGELIFVNFSGQLNYKKILMQKNIRFSC